MYKKWIKYQVYKLRNAYYHHISNRSIGKVSHDIGMV